MDIESEQGIQTLLLWLIGHTCSHLESQLIDSLNKYFVHLLRTRCFPGLGDTAGDMYLVEQL